MSTEDLTPEQETELRTDLDALIADLSEQLAATEEGAGPVDLSLPIGRLSRMEAMQQAKMAEAGRRLNEQRLRLARSALVNFDAGTYGWCRNCDEPIGYKRLKARPESALCVRCQEALDRR